MLSQEKQFEINNQHSIGNPPRTKKAKRKFTSLNATVGSIGSIERDSINSFVRCFFFFGSCIYNCITLGNYDLWITFCVSPLNLYVVVRVSFFVVVLNVWFAQNSPSIKRVCVSFFLPIVIMCEFVLPPFHYFMLR